ncbi:hypothetical protein [Staphylococcus haemolyticus]|uniref:hypothetical protein n=1 Tax=Staphylococcus haemolyticus TaxID=1283 RepID=UPI001E49D649|nr:hypothetical protein [Staphylococcus haemolyticus]MCC3722361.1 hypothetical protein [Staphylococcus haemolyticus]
MEFNEFKNHLTFFRYVNNGPYPDENEEETLYSCFCKIYSPVIKDMEILKSNETKITLNVVIRDASEFYIVKSNHMIKIDKAIYMDKLFAIKEIRVNQPREHYITLLVSEV